jgi:hypothetical protein
MLGNQGVYSDEYSSLGNVFDAKLGRTKAQMLRLFILSAMVNYNSSAVAEYIEGEEVARQLRSLGFGDDTTLQVLTDLCRHRFAFTASHTEPTLESSFFPTRLGGYVTRVLMAELAFLENTMMDTFVADEQVWRELKALTEVIHQERDIMARLRVRKRRAEVFFEFVKGMYTPLRNEAGRRGLPAEWCGHPIEAIEPQFREGLNYAMRSAHRNYSETPGIESENG